MNEASRTETHGGKEWPRWLRPALMATAAVLVAAATFLPLWGMTLVSVQYPEGLRMVVYPTRIVGDITEINMLNHYIGMREISDGFFPELRIVPALFALIAIVTLGGAAVRRWWAALLPLGLMAGTAAYGFASMRSRLYQFGHELDPTAAIEIDPFTPPMVGENTIAQFASYTYFSWGTFLPVIAGVLVAAALWLDLRRPPRERAPEPARTGGTMSRNPGWTASAALVAAAILLSGCSPDAPAGDAAAASAAPAAEAAAPEGPSAADRDFAAITASWSPELLETCGRGLEEALGTRDLVQGAIDGVDDPDGRATDELKDARHWKELGDAKLAEVRPTLEGGACDADVAMALDEAVQFYVKSGTSAVQAGQMAGS